MKFKLKKFLKKIIPPVLSCLYSERRYLNDYKNYILGQKTILKNRDKTKICPTIVFVVQFPEVWNSVRTIYEATEKCNINSIVLCVPKPVKDESTNIFICDRKTNEAYVFLKEKGIKVVDAFDSAKNCWVDLRKFQPDYVIYTRPYNNQYPEVYRSTEICKYAKVCYVPYAFSQTDNDLFYITYNPEFILTTYITFCPSKIRLKDCQKKYSVQCLLKTNQFKYLGFPRFDILQQEVMQVKDTKKKEKKLSIAWLPRWTVGNCEYTKKSNFFKYYESFIDYAKKHENIELIIRPHPLMFSSIVENNIMSENEIDVLKKDILSYENIILDDKKDYLPILLQADVLVADFTSLLIEYFVTGKPIIYCDSADDFNSDALLMDSTLYHASEWKEVENVLNQLIDGEDSNYYKRETVINHFIPQNVGRIGYEILDYIVSDFTNVKISTFKGES